MYRKRFERNFGLDNDEFQMLGKYRNIAARMRCTPVDGLTKTAVVSFKGKWRSHGKKDWEEGSSWRDVKVTIASFTEAKAMGSG
jgi:hypothetical protein